MNHADVLVYAHDVLDIGNCLIPIEFTMLYAVIVENVVIPHHRDDADYVVPLCVVDAHRGGETAAVSYSALTGIV